MTEERVILDRWEVLRELGTGGFGTTYAAKDRETGERVALKAFDLSRVDDWKALELFEREANTLKQLKHAFIPRYVEFVPVEADETGYLVQSLAEGTPLDRVLEEKGRLTTEQVEGIAERTLEILEYLASLHPPVVHRDIKPANLILNENGDVYLVDFGAVQDAAKKRVEGGSTVAGTFGYMAPEQLHGNASPKSDLYGLGMTLLHLVAGRSPSDFEQRGLRIHWQDEVEVDATLEEFITRLSEPDPDERFESAADALAFLRNETSERSDLVGLARSDDAMKAAVAKSEEKRLARKKQAEEERRELALRAANRDDRLSFAFEENEAVIAYRPPWITDAVPLGIMIFGLSGVVAFIASFPFAFWPEVVGGWARAAIVMFVATLVYLWTMRGLVRPKTYRLTDDAMYGLYEGDAEKPYAAGKFDTVSVSADIHKDLDHGTGGVALMRDGNVVQHLDFYRLSKSDVANLKRFIDRWKPAGAKNVSDNIAWFKELDEY